MRNFFALGYLASTVIAGPYENRPANVDCPLGYNLVGKKCEQNIFSPAMITCSLGQLQGNKCVTTVQPILACPIGAEMDGNVCKVFQYDQPTAECPSGFHLEGSACMLKKPLPLTEACDMGRPDGRGNCIHTEHVTRLTKKSCPAGFYDEGHGCAKTTTYDCSPDEVLIKKPVFLPAPIVSKETEVVAPVAAPVFTSVSNYKKQRFNRMLNARRSPQSYSPISIAPVLAAPSKGAPTHVKPAIPAPLPQSNVAVVKQLCQREDYTPYVTESFCPQGYAANGDECISTTTFPMVQRCITGGSANACYEPKTAPVNMRCNVGALVGEKCVVAEVINQETVCPAGTDRVGGVCQQLTTPNVSCPPGTTLDGQNCIGKVFTEPTGIVTQPCTGKACWQ